MAFAAVLSPKAVADTPGLSDAIAQLNSLPTSPASGSDSAMWRLESARQFIRVGTWFAQHAQAAYAAQAAQSAQNQVAAAASMTNDAKQPGLAGARNEVAGQVCELQGNTSAAIADYQAAVALNPGCSQAAARLQVLAPSSE